MADAEWLDVCGLLAIFNSTVFTALYNTLFQGIVVGGETYHYLPAFLRVVPVPPIDHPALGLAAQECRALHPAEAPVDPSAWLRVDRWVAEAYGVTEEARLRMVQTHLVRVGADHPG